MKAFLAEEGHTFNFFSAVKLVLRLWPEASPIGELGPPQTEALRFMHSPELIFHAGDIAAIRPRVMRSMVPFAEIEATFLGLFGASSPLATFMSEEVIRAEAADQKSLRAFYDILHHRLYSLFYRAWKKYRFSAGFRTDGTDAFTRRALAFVGVDAGGAIPKAGLPATDLLTLAPLLAVRTRSTRTLQIILERLLPDVQVHIESFVKRRVRLDHDQRVLLGVQNSTLNEDFTIGRSVDDRSGRFRVSLGPVDYNVFEALMPGGRYHATLRKIIEQFSRGVLEAELELRLSDEESPRFQLNNPRGAVLATNTHLTSKRKGAMRARVVLSENMADAKPQLIEGDPPD